MRRLCRSKFVRDSTRGRPRGQADRRAGVAPALNCTVYLSIPLTSCRQLLSGRARARSAVHGGAGAPARNTTSLSQIPRVPARGVQREELREGLHHVRVQVGLLE